VGKPEGGHHFEDPGVDGMDLREVEWGARSGSIWVMIGEGGGLLCIR
jgi:hypothetical protein